MGHFFLKNLISATALLCCLLCLSCGRDEGAEPVLTASRETSFTGRGNRAEVLVRLFADPGQNMNIKKVLVRLDAAAGDVTGLSVRQDGAVLGSVKVKAGKDLYRIPCAAGSGLPAALEICADIAQDATEGGRVRADVVKAKTGLFAWTKIPEPPAGAREILLVRTKVLGPGDYGSACYRIPALLALADGTLLIATDKRKNNGGDLPEDIDVIVQRSRDGGRSWSDPVTVAEGKGYGKGFGDAALESTASGKVLCVYSGGAGIWASDLKNPQTNFYTRSTDGGLTWEEPKECTAQLWGPRAARPECRSFHSAFFASGRGLRLKSGRVLFVAALHSRQLGRFDNYIFYTDDEGDTWQVSECAYRGGDEAKLVELPDGRVLISVRRNGERGYNISEDGGVTWGTQGVWKDMCVNACNGDILACGDSLLLHSVPNSMKRENVSIFLSRDGGKTWPAVKSICPYASIYSSLAILPDGTIGAYVEENPDGDIEMWYMNFSLDWLTAE